MLNVDHQYLKQQKFSLSFYCKYILIAIFLVFAVCNAYIASSEPILVIDSPEVLTKLQTQLPISKWLGYGDETNNEELAKHPYYRSVIDTIVDDLDYALKKDPSLSVTMAKAHRLFNQRWLFSKNAHYELVGVVNRLDRQAFTSKTCGEVRLIYRLAYQSSRNNFVIESRLPFTVNVVFWLPNDQHNCQTVAETWSLEKPLSIAALTTGKGPLHKDQLHTSQLKSVEINMQAIRWPSTIRADMGGYAEYFLRVFKLNASQQRFELAFLENTPSIDKISNTVPRQH